MSEKNSPAGSAKATYFRNVLERFSAHKLAVAGLCILGLEILLVTVLPPLLHLTPRTFWPSVPSPGRGMCWEPTMWAATCWHAWYTAGGFL